MHSTSIRTLLRDRLKKLRKEQGLTQEKMAQKAGISLYYLQLLEGKRPTNPSLLVLEKLADSFNMPVWQLLKFDGE